MSGETRTYWFVPFRVRGTETLEAWFEEMARQGWVADRLGFLSAVRMELRWRKGGRNYRYVIDPRRFPDAPEDSLIASAGWEDVGTLNGKDVWRAPYEGARPDLFVDE
ncbi:DUF2812 domain-containing protein [Mumia sp. ZJ1417]|uniref:DUF2812 domain-containing protein n=1 Tax=Mumia sp. ZJ1417 TaxID=2708082 RepID=UPI00142233C9|nr:DUF2812 domain-containing protein [Mumia sp. ZJ1417]QMW66810.1 DUF2812 domain-containing protein [Mumia sp. ZJ1417]